MLHFFNSIHNPSIGVLEHPLWPYIQEGLQRNLTTVKEYYYNKPFAVKSNHILVRVLNSLGVSFKNNLERYSDIVDSKAFYIGMNFKMSSPIYRGNIFRDIFYGGDIDEVLVVDDTPFDIYDVYNNWKTITAVTVIQHPKSDLSLLLPNGKYFGTESGTAVISINIAKLAVQFKAFLDKEIKQLDNNISPLTVAQFVHMYVLPNMLDSHLDIALFNRAFNMLLNNKMGISYKRHVFYLVDFSDKIDTVYSYLIQHYRLNERYYSDILKAFPVVTNSNFKELLKLPDLAPTRQMIWVNVVSRIRAIEFLVKISNYHGNKLDRSNNNMFLRYFKLYENDRALDNILNNNSQMQNKIAINEVKDLILSTQ